MTRILPPRQCNPFGGKSGSRAGCVTAKAMEGAKSLEMQRRRTRRGMGSGTVRRRTQELGKPSLARRVRSCGACRRITGETREVAGGQEGGEGGRSSNRSTREYARRPGPPRVLHSRSPSPCGVRRPDRRIRSGWGNASCNPPLWKRSHRQVPEGNMPGLRAACLPRRGFQRVLARRRSLAADRGSPARSGSSFTRRVPPPGPQRARRRNPQTGARARV